MKTISRRAFLQGIAALVGTTVAAPAFAVPRSPFVDEGEFVSSIVFHLWDKPRAPCSISMLVHQIQPWDGIGYPIVLARTGFRREDRELFDGWYDFEWSNFRRDVPDRFWAIPGHWDRYPNIHAFVREHRFGESPEVMRLTMERNRLVGPPAVRPTVSGRRVAA